MGGGEATTTWATEEEEIRVEGVGASEGKVPTAADTTTKTIGAAARSRTKATRTASNTSSITSKPTIITTRTSRIRRSVAVDRDSQAAGADTVIPLLRAVATTSARHRATSHLVSGTRISGR